MKSLNFILLTSLSCLPSIHTYSAERYSTESYSTERYSPERCSSERCPPETDRNEWPKYERYNEKVDIHGDYYNYSERPTTMQASIVPSEDVCAPDESPVHITWRMNLCHLYDRCPIITIEIPNRIYENLGSPKQAFWTYNLNRDGKDLPPDTLHANFVPDPHRNQYHLVNTCPQTDAVYSYILTEVCLRAGSGNPDNCQKASLDARSMNEPTLHQTLCYKLPKYQYRKK